MILWTRGGWRGREGYFHLQKVAYEEVLRDEDGEGGKDSFLYRRL